MTYSKNRHDTCHRQCRMPVETGVIWHYPGNGNEKKVMNIK